MMQVMCQCSGGPAIGKICRDPQRSNKMTEDGWPHRPSTLIVERPLSVSAPRYRVSCGGPRYGNSSNRSACGPHLSQVSLPLSTVRNTCPSHRPWASIRLRVCCGSASNWIRPGRSGSRLLAAASAPLSRGISSCMLNDVGEHRHESFVLCRLAIEIRFSFSLGQEWGLSGPRSTVGLYPFAVDLHEGPMP